MFGDAIASSVIPPDGLDSRAGVAVTEASLRNYVKSR